jgi:glutamate-1-semialdehyde 2,1-aminomutase
MVGGRSIDSDVFSLHRRAQQCIAQGYLTNSKRPESHVKGVYPSHVSYGRGCYLWDHRGGRYLDFICGLGTNLLGYGNEIVSQAIASQLRGGYSHSFATHHELDAAETLKAVFPFTEAWKFLKSGSEACSAAIRIARAATGRKWVLSEGYHGHHDPFVSLTAPALGVPLSGEGPNNLCMASLNGLMKVEDQDVAAVIIEPVITDWSDARRKWLQDLRERCTKHGALLIFDEVITGFRFPKFSVSSFWGIEPDLIVIGKALANGMPLAAVGGKYAVMNGAEYFVSSTYAGEVLSLAAAKATMALLLQGTRYDLVELWKKGQRFLDEFNAVCPEKVRIEGYPTRGAFTGDPLCRALFFQEACKAGLLFGPSWFFNWDLAAEVKDAMGVIKSIFGRVDRGEVKLEGEVPQSPFAQRVREASK